MDKTKFVDILSSQLYGFSIDTVEDCVYVAEILYNAGYRKIPEGAVVLTKAELAQIQSNFFDAGIKHGSKETVDKFAEMAEQESVYFNLNGTIYKAVHIEDINAIRDKITEGKV